MKMDADVVVTTLEDLETFYLKRSYVRKDIEYVFMFHHMMSCHLTPTRTAYDHYDTLLCIGPHQVAEVRRAEELYGLPAKNLVEAGYDLIDEEIAAYEQLVREEREAGVNDDVAGKRPTVLVAPSWQEGNLLDSCFDELAESLLGRGWRVIVRPHPEYTKRFRARWEALQARYAAYGDDELYFERDFSSNRTIWTSDVLITDWSSVACEFSFSTLKPCIFVDTPMKVGNPEWQDLGIEPTDISLRNQIGISFDPDRASEVGETVADMLERSEEWRESIAEIRDGFIFNVGHGAETSGEYLIEAMLRKQLCR